ncbi:SGNH/GDSL hydrolase family protein [Methylobacterium sp. Leaf111]|uniref:SGNH/GDSL hydrolase family protein n=1 Tax=Methylobacterium sp. Leaf111 TaxID=1736257 RepID=UPI00138F498D|nr:SGNH/GDSL hydrolase family protein [Methylobacterium sp. Leaf111]
MARIAISSENHQDLAMDSAASNKCGNTINIVTFGTSLTNQNGWQIELKNNLSSIWKKNVEVAKVASGGKTSRWGLENISRVAQFKPSIVLVEFVINDSDVRHQIWLKESLDNHVRIIKILKNEVPDVKIYLMTMSPALGLRRWLLRPFINNYNAQYLDISKRLGVGLIDIAPMWHSPGVDLTKVIPDGVHPTREAVLQITVPAISRVLLKDECVR